MRHYAAATPPLRGAVGLTPVFTQTIKTTIATNEIVSAARVACSLRSAVQRPDHFWWSTACTAFTLFRAECGPLSPKTSAAGFRLVQRAAFRRCWRPAQGEVSGFAQLCRVGDFAMSGKIRRNTGCGPVSRCG